MNLRPEDSRLIATDTPEQCLRRAHELADFAMREYVAEFLGMSLKTHGDAFEKLVTSDPRNILGRTSIYLLDTNRMEDLKFNLTRTSRDLLARSRLPRTQKALAEAIGSQDLSEGLSWLDEGLSAILDEILASGGENEKARNRLLSVRLLLMQRILITSVAETEALGAGLVTRVGLLDDILSATLGTMVLGIRGSLGPDAPDPGEVVAAIHRAAARAEPAVRNLYTVHLEDMTRMTGKT